MQDGSAGCQQNDQKSSDSGHAASDALRTDGSESFGSPHFEAIRCEFPDAPEAELLRFCRARPASGGDASKLYAEYLTWRQGDGTKERLSAAFASIPESYIRYLGTVARDGSPTFYIHAAYFHKLVPAEEFVLGICYMMDTILTAEEMLKVTVLADVRLYDGAPNVLAPNQVPYLQLLWNTMSNLYPERLQQLVIYPIPFYAKPLWALLSRMMDEATRRKIVLLKGQVHIGAPCPAEIADIIVVDKLPEDLHEAHSDVRSSGGKN